MAAICGILGRRDRKTVQAMAEAMAHRGRATHVAQGDAYTVASSVAFGNTLCLLDGTARGPAGDALGPAELQGACEALGLPDALEVQGGFAAAVQVGREWWLIRDRLGRKPLYYAPGDGWVLFASELKGLLASGLVSKHLNLASVDRYLTLRCVPGPETIIQGVRRVRPGHVLAFADGQVNESAFATFDLSVHDTTRDEAAAQLRDLLGRSLERCSAEGLLWSAGIDCAALAGLGPGRPAVFVALKSSWQEEAWRARESARLLGVQLESRKPRRFSERMFEQVAYHLDEPVADASVFPLWMIAEQASRDASVLMSGHGADELLGGYPRYHFMQRAHGAKRLVPVNFLSGLLPALPPNAVVRRGGRYLSSIRDNLEAYLSLLSVFDHHEREDLYTDAMKAAIYEKGGSPSVMRPHFLDGDLTHNLLALDLNVGLPDLLLAQCDRLMAAHGATLEFPYLDDALVDFALSMPPKVKYGVRSKPLLRQAMRGVLPGRIRQRARRGFRVPLDGPAVRVIDKAAHDIVTQERVEASGLFKWPYVQRVLAAKAHNIYRRRQFWALLMFFAWYRTIMER